MFEAPYGFIGPLVDLILAHVLPHLFFVEKVKHFEEVPFRAVDGQLVVEVLLVVLQFSGVVFLRSITLASFEALFKDSNQCVRPMPKVAQKPPLFFGIRAHISVYHKIPKPFFGLLKLHITQF